MSDTCAGIRNPKVQLEVRTTQKKQLGIRASQHREAHIDIMKHASKSTHLQASALHSQECARSRQAHTIQACAI